MKNFRYLVMALVMLGIFCFMPVNKAEAVDDVGFTFYYQSIEEVKQINEPINDDDSLWTKIKKTGKKAVNWVGKTWEECITRNFAIGEGEKTWYSGEDSNIAYKVNRVKVSSEAELLAAMGASSEDELSNGQKALLASFRAAYSDAMKDRAEASYRSNVNVILSDTTGFDDASKYPHVRKDFWPCSTGFTINMSSNCYNYSSGPEDAASTMIHEYAHCMDTTIKELINPYGKDGSHYGNEITGERSAFVEGWAEYNEMIESEKEAQGIINNTKSLVQESKSEAGSYTTVLPEDATSEQLRAAESYNAYLMYRLATEIDDGEAKVTKAFTDTRWKLFRDLSTLIKRFIKNNPDDADKVVRIVDETFLFKFTDEELMDMCGKSDAVKNYIATRGQQVETEGVDVEAARIEANVSSEKIQVETTDNTNPFSVE